MRHALFSMLITAVTFCFSACHENARDLRDTSVQISLLEVIAGLEGTDGVNWKAVSIIKNRQLVSEGDGFVMHLSYLDKITARYSIQENALSDEYWPNYASQSKEGTLTFIGIDDITLDIGTSQASVLTFGGNIPTNATMVLEWISDKGGEDAVYTMTLEAVW